MRSRKRKIVDWIRRRLAGSSSPYLVASMGRVGSTLVFEALVEGVTRHRFGQTGFSVNLACLVRSWAFDLKQTPLIGGVVYKTHDFPVPELATRKPKVIFVFGSASQAAVSVYSCMDRYGREWVDIHLRHLRAKGRFEDMWTDDILGFEDQINAWTQMANLDVLAIRYETMWDHERTISDFFGIRVVLPPRRNRLTASADPEILYKAQSVYGGLDKRIASLPDVFRPPLVKTETPLGSGS